MNWPFVTRQAFELSQAECERLRAENRALLNSVLIAAGQKPVERASEPLEPVKRKARPSWFQWGMRMTASAAKEARENPSGSVPQAQN